MGRTRAFSLIGVIFLLAFADSSIAAEISGKEVYKYCKSCHGQWAKGGEQGKYPRLAGLPKEYIERQLHDFKNKRRINKPMIPIFKHFRFDGDVIEAVAAYISGMSNTQVVWVYEPSKEALAYFDTSTALEESGKTTFVQECAQCHDNTGSGEPDTAVPPISNQYPEYLKKQIADFRSGERQHEHSASCSRLSPEELEAVLYYLAEGKS